MPTPPPPLPHPHHQGAFRNLYGRTLNFNQLSAAVKKLSDWYEDNGVLGQVRGGMGGREGGRGGRKEGGRGGGSAPGAGLG